MVPPQVLDMIYCGRLGKLILKVGFLERMGAKDRSVFY